MEKKKIGILILLVTCMLGTISSCTTENKNVAINNTDNQRQLFSTQKITINR